jgi:hypothetical protein
MVAQILQRHVSALHTPSHAQTHTQHAQHAQHAPAFAAPPPPPSSPRACVQPLSYGESSRVDADAVEEDAAQHERAIALALFGDDEQEQAAQAAQRAAEAAEAAAAAERGAWAEARDDVATAPLPSLPSTLVRMHASAQERACCSSASVCVAH